MRIQLPNGLIDEVDLFNYAEIDELKGKQQNYLVNKDLVLNNIGHVPKLLEDLILSLETKEGLKWKGDIKEAIWKLPSGDLETILVKIRENTFGPKYYHQGVCPHCEYTNKGLRLDLDTLELTTMNKKDLFSKKKNTYKLPKSGIEVQLKPFYLKDLFDVIKITSGDPSELITSITAISIKRLGDNEKVTKKDLDELSASDICFIQDTLEEAKLEGFIDTTVEMTCDRCHKDFSQKLNVFDSDFFAHTKATNN